MARSSDPLDRLERDIEAILVQRQQAAQAASQEALPGLLEFIPQLSPRFSSPRHLGAFAAVLERCPHQPVRACVSLPPRHGKTELLLHAIVWLLLANPALRIGYASYSQDFANDKSDRCRELALEAGLKLSKSTKAKKSWKTPQGGGLWATSVGGSITGLGFDLLIIDDPHKGRAEAESGTIRDRIASWFSSDADSRLEPGGSVICCQTRWHPDDLAGRLSAEPGYETINIPAINLDGEALWPERWPLLELLRIQERKGGPEGYDWMSLYMGQPRGRGTRVFGDAHIQESAPPLGLARIVIGIDFAYTAKTSADYSVAVVMAEVGGQYFILEVVRVQLQPRDFRARVQLLLKQYPTATAAAYVAATEQGGVEFLRDGGISITGHRATADKFSRAIPVAAAWNTGKIFIPETTKSNEAWLDPFVSEVAGFTGLKDRHDDQVDALAAAFDALHVLDIDWDFHDRLKGAWPQALSF